MKRIFDHMKKAIARSVRFTRLLLPSFAMVKAGNRTSRLRSAAIFLALLQCLSANDLSAQQSPSFSSFLLAPAMSWKDSAMAQKNVLLTGSVIDTMRPSFNKKNRIAWVAAANVAFYAGSLIALNEAWYKDYPKTSFHTFNDSREWLQVDKIGHGWTAYTTGKYLTDMWEWAGLTRRKAVWAGGLSGAAYLTVIEVLDAYSAEWGWSWSDMGANVFGSALFMGQEFMWQEQRVQFKFSFHHNSYDDPALEQRAASLFGKPWYERMLKDYNAQTYWFSANLHSFFKQSKLPEWLNVAVGYGAEGMFGGFENSWTDKNGVPVTRYDIARKRQFYLAPDIDFTKIKTRSKFLRTTFSLLNAFKCPAPALMLDSKGKLKGYAIFF